MEHRRPWGWTETDYEMLDVLFHQGLGNDEIAQCMDRTVATVTAALKRRGLRRGEKNCRSCGRVLDHPKSGRRRIYCSKACGEVYRATPPTDTTPPAVDRPPVCQGCGQELTQDQIRRRALKRLPLDYCSGNCRQAARVLAEAASG